jgi:hypothetical protein
MKSCPAADKLGQWLDRGAQGRLTLLREDFPEGILSLSALIACCPWRERLRHRWRSFCAWRGRCALFPGGRIRWYRWAGAAIADGVVIGAGAVLDLLFPQLVTLEEGAVLGLGAVVVSHVYTPDRIVVARSLVGKRATVREQAILAIAEMGEDSELAPCGYTVKPIPAGHVGVGVPALVCPREESSLTEAFFHDRRA